MTRRFFTADAKINPVLITVKGHIATCTDLRRSRSAYSLVSVSRFHLAGLAVGKQLFEIDLYDLHRLRRRRSLTSAWSGRDGSGTRGIAKKKQPHRVASYIQHSSIAALGNLHDLTRFCIHGQRLAFNQVRTEDQPLAVRGPLVWGLIDLGIARRRAGEECEHRARNRVLYHFLLRRKSSADLCIGCSRKNDGDHDSKKNSKAFHTIISETRSDLLVSCSSLIWLASTFEQ